MLNYRDSLPKDRTIAGVHCIPITEQGMIMLSWDKAEQQMTNYWRAFRKMVRVWRKL